MRPPVNPHIMLHNTYVVRIHHDLPHALASKHSSIRTTILFINNPTTALTWLLVNGTVTAEVLLRTEYLMQHLETEADQRHLCIHVRCWKFGPNRAGCNKQPQPIPLTVHIRRINNGDDFYAQKAHE